MSFAIVNSFAIATLLIKLPNAAVVIAAWSIDFYVFSSK